MDFYRIVERPAKEGVVEVYPDFLVKRSKDIMVRGGAFYAVWDQDAGLWSTDEYDIQRLIDNDIRAVADEVSKRGGASVRPKYLSSFSTGAWQKYSQFVTKVPDNYVQLDRELTFSNTEVDKNRYASKRLPYPLVDGDISAYSELMDVLYNPEEREKLEWAVGSIISGDSKDIQKFIVLYGLSGAGKSTFLNIVHKLFEGYYGVFDAKSLTNGSSAFAMEAFKNNPMVVIQHDGDLSKIEDNTKLNSIVSHEEMTINEKNKTLYSMRLDAFLFMGTNKPVKITDAKSGIIRRLIDVQPSGRKLPYKRYKELTNQINFELGHIAKHCLDVYLSMGPDYYDDYIPEEMMLMTDYFYNYIETYFDLFREQDAISLAHAYSLYKEYVQDSQISYSLNRVTFREELKNYFEDFEERATINGERVRSWYSKFKTDRFKVLTSDSPNKKLTEYAMDLSFTESILDQVLSDCPAQPASPADTPMYKWSDVHTTLKDIDTTKVHYVKPPENHIVIDFDLKNSQGEKSAELNLEAAASWPPTYTEFSKGGAGVHLHYIYEGDVSELAPDYSPGIEVKVFRGGSALRRRVSYCNDLPVASISSGLPIKEHKVLNTEGVKSEKALRDLVERNLRKEIHGATKPSMDFIKKILDDAYNSGLVYDLEDMRPRIMSFANSSSNQALYCLKLVMQLKLVSEGAEMSHDISGSSATEEVVPVFYDVEVFRNRFIICWKKLGVDNVVRMVNPSASEVEMLMKRPLVGFNNRGYDNHILYGAMMGMNNEELYNLSQRIINNEKGANFASAYGISYTDIYDYASKKQTLKKWQIELGIHHQELGHPWEEPLPEELFEKAEEYCANDVISTEAVWNATQADFKARQILAAISGLTVNDPTKKHTSRIIFQGDKNHKDHFEYFDLTQEFPGYEYSFGKSTYKGIEVGEGGYVYSEPGIYKNVALIDVASMHPNSAINMNIFGKYTKNYKDLLDARIAIKHGDFEAARKMLDGKLAPYLNDESMAKELSFALKIVINIVYGLTAASFDNDFRDMRNKDNIVAKRGALFMVDLLEAVKDKGYTVVHIKTDSIKIADADDHIIEFVTEFGKTYGYDFEHEDTYEKMCLVNKAVYIAYSGGEWHATGAEFAHPYVFKQLFSHEPIDFKDLCEAKQVKSAMYIDSSANEILPPEEGYEPRFIGKVGSFCPMTPDAQGAGALLRSTTDGGFASVTGTKGYLWMESEVVTNLGFNDFIDMSYFENLVYDARNHIAEYGDVETFLKV